MHGDHKKTRLLQEIKKTQAYEKKDILIILDS